MTARKTHIIRLYKDDDTESDTWVDIERLDELYFESGRGPQYREKRWKFDWDDFDPESKNVTKKQIVDPNDEDNFIEVPVRDSIFVHEARGDQYYSYKKKFLNDVSNQRRETVSRQVFHHDIPEEYLDNDGQPPSDPDDYLASLGEQDIDQYVEVELLAKYWTDQKDAHDAQGKLKSASAWQGKKWLYNDDDVDPLLRDPMLETDEVDPDFVPVNNPIDGPIVDPPWRLDPLQNIVNISWGGALDFAVGGTVRDATSRGPIGVFFSKKKTADDDDAFGRTDMDSAPAPAPPTDHRPVSAGGMGPRGTGMWFNHILSMVGGTFKAEAEEEEDEKIFVAVGFRSDMIGLSNIVADTNWHYNFQTKALIFWSDDGGGTWTEASCPITAPPGEGTTTPGTGTDVTVQLRSVAFDPATETFYADVWKFGQELTSDYFERSLISSADGKLWTVESTDRRPGIPDAWTAPFITKLRTIASNGLNEITSPDGVTLAYTTVTEIPDAAGGRLELSGPWKIDPEPEGELKEDHVLLSDIPCPGVRSGIAYANGRFMIAGSLLSEDSPDYRVQAYVSADNGLNWKLVLDDDSSFTIVDTINVDPPYCAGSCGCAG